MNFTVGKVLDKFGSNDMRDPHAYKILRNEEELWDIFTRKEEYRPAQLDEHDRFPYSPSLYKDITDPRLSRYFVDNGFQAEYPDDRKFAVCLTHDVDEIYPPRSHSILSSIYYIKSLDLTGLKNQVFWKSKGQEASPYWNFKDIMALEDKFNAKSTFFFMSAKRDVRRFRYNIESLEGKLGSIVDAGWEVGLHGGYYAYNNLEEIVLEKQRLERVVGREVIGYRNHYLRFMVPKTWELLAEAGFMYDSTFGYGDAVGFRNGMCHPFRPYNLKSDGSIDILEIPLCIMDTALWKSGPRTEDMWNTVEKMMDVTEKFGGVLTLLWHNNMFNCPFRDRLCKIYEKILADAQKRRAWLASADEIYKWWIDGEWN